MTRTHSRLWFVLFALMVAAPAAAQVADCTGQADATPCIDTDGDVCTVAACSSNTCNQQFDELPAGTPCTDTDGNTCTIARCRTNDSECNQGSAREPEGTACTANGVPGFCSSIQNGSLCIPTEQNAPTLSMVGTAGLTAMLLGLGFWTMRRRAPR